MQVCGHHCGTRGSSLCGFTQLHAFVEAVIHLALLLPHDPARLPSGKPRLPESAGYHPESASYVPECLTSLISGHLERLEAELERRDARSRAVGAAQVREALGRHQQLLRLAFDTYAEERAGPEPSQEGARAASQVCPRDGADRVRLPGWLELVRRSTLPTDVPVGRKHATEAFVRARRLGAEHERALEFQEFQDALVRVGLLQHDLQHKGGSTSAPYLSAARLVPVALVRLEQLCEHMEASCLGAPDAETPCRSRKVSREAGCSQSEGEGATALGTAAPAATLVGVAAPVERETSAGGGGGARRATTPASAPAPALAAAPTVAPVAAPAATSSARGGGKGGVDGTAAVVARADHDAAHGRVVLERLLANKEAELRGVHALLQQDRAPPPHRKPPLTYPCRAAAAVL